VPLGTYLGPGAYGTGMYLYRKYDDYEEPLETPDMYFFLFGRSSYSPTCADMVRSANGVSGNPAAERGGTETGMKGAYAGRLRLLLQRYAIRCNTDI